VPAVDDLTEEERRQHVSQLVGQLNVRSSRLAVYDRYYRGVHPLAYTSERFRQAFGGRLDSFADNWCPLVVDAAEERLNVNGFRFGDDSADDRDAWRIWQANGLDADSQLAHVESLVFGVSYGMVWPGDTEGDDPLVTVEHPDEVLVELEAGSRRRRRSAIKRWTGEDGRLWVNLYTPDTVWKYRSTSATADGAALEGVGGAGWEPRPVRGEGWPIPNPLGIVPAVPLVNRPRLRQPYGESELHNVLAPQDAVNKLTSDLLIASEFGAFRQRWATGLDIPTNPATGEPVEPFAAAIDRLWVSENPETRFGEFTESNLDGYVRAIELLVQHIASQTRTPPHYFYLGGGQPPSGESIKSAETGLVAKVRRKQRHYGEGWEELMRLAFLAKGDRARARVTTAETLWGDAESRTEGEHVDAVLKRKALGVPFRQLMEDLGYSPTQVDRFASMRAEESALLGGFDSLFADTAPAPALGPGTSV
jgi:hypothetical protein